MIVLGEGKGRIVYVHPAYSNLVIKELIKSIDEEPINPNIIEFIIWHKFKHFPEISSVLTPIRSMSSDTKFLIMERVYQPIDSKRINKLNWHFDAKSKNYGFHKPSKSIRICDYGNLETLLNLDNWRKNI